MAGVRCYTLALCFTVKDTFYANTYLPERGTIPAIEQSQATVTLIHTSMSTQPIKPTTPAPATPPAAPAPTPLTLDWDAARAHLDNVEREVKEKFAGKDGCNPFLFIAERIRPLRDRLAVGQKTQELYDAIFSILPVEPKVDMLSTKGGLLA